MRPINLNNSPIKLDGVQFARPILPPDLHTRAISLAARSWLGVNITPKVDSTTSNELSEKGRFSASAS